MQRRPVFCRKTSAVCSRGRGELSSAARNGATWLSGFGGRQRTLGVCWPVCCPSAAPREPSSHLAPLFCYLVRPCSGSFEEALTWCWMGSLQAGESCLVCRHPPTLPCRVLPARLVWPCVSSIARKRAQGVWRVKLDE